jgi:hypothetical protein
MLGLAWNPELKVGDILILFGFIFTIAGLIFTVREIGRNTRVQRAQFLLEITERYFGDPEVRKFYYKIDYDQFKFDREKFLGTDEERWLDSLIYTFDIIGYLLRIGVLSKEEVSILAFQASQVLRNSEVIKYLKWLDDEYKGLDRPTPAHSDARYLAQIVLP